MQDGTCPKCKARDVYKGRPGNDNASFSLGMFDDAKLIMYACARCGYVETYLMDFDDRQLIARKWKKITTSRQQTTEL